MKKYVKSSKNYVKASSEYNDMLSMKIEDFFKIYADAYFEDDPEADLREVANFIAAHMVDLLDFEEWEDLAFDWLQFKKE